MSNVRALANLVWVVFIIGTAYVTALAPVRVLSGRAESRADYAAGALGVGWWAICVNVYTGGPHL